ncbi:DUF1127 domain-containing protein [Bradyrhizobium sp. USDA 3364]
MSIATELGRTTASTPQISNLIWRSWTALRAYQEGQRLRRSLSRLSDWELQDMGISRGEIDYVADNRSIDPRGAVGPP